MILSRSKLICCIALMAGVTIFTACHKDWAEHNDTTDDALKNNLYQAISKTATLGKFSDMLVKTGYDKILSSSKTYTVWAPSDQALQSLDPAISSDTAKLKQFVGNHIANQSYLAGASASQRIQMLNGKYNIMAANKFDSASITIVNQYANNGVFHVIDKFIPRYDNCWELIKNTSAAPLMKSYLLSLNYTGFDSTKATQIGVNPTNGQPLWDSTNGKIASNVFWNKVQNINDESNQYTVFLLTDNAYTTEFNKITPWFKTSTTDSTTNLSSFHLVKDLAFKGLYNVADLPDTLVSQYGVKTPIKKSAIIASYKTSNGVVHIMNQADFTKENKFPPIYIQGELPSRFMVSRPANTFYRVRYNPLTGQNFNDIMMTNYGVADYSIAYFRSGINSMRYNAYWVALNDIQAGGTSAPLWQQRLACGFIRNDTSFRTTTFPAVSIGYNVYSEISLGQFTFPNYADQYFFVLGPTTSSTSGNANAITLDYIKLVPAF